MKQAIDTFTMELPDMGQPLTAAEQLAVRKHEDFHAMRAVVEAERKAKREQPKARYRFYIRTHSAQTEWCGLTSKQARDMYAYTDKRTPNNVIAYGWEEQK